MKKYLLLSLLTTFIFTSKLNAQILNGQSIFQNTSKNSYYILSSQDDKDVLNDLKDYSRLMGLFSENGKNNYKIERLKVNGFSNDLNSINIGFENSRRVLKVGFFFLDKDLKTIQDTPENIAAEQKFVNDFNAFTQKSLTIKLAENQVKVNQDNLDDANRAVSKLERKIESNLKDQDKLNKKLEESPSLIDKAVSEKEDLITKKYSDSTLAASGDLDKKAAKKEKEISRIQKDQSKASSKLDKINQEFEDLKNELSNAKNFQKEVEKVYSSSVQAVSNLKK